MEARTHVGLLGINTVAGKALGAEVGVLGQQPLNNGQNGGIQRRRIQLASGLKVVDAGAVGLDHRGVDGQAALQQPAHRRVPPAGGQGKAPALADEIVQRRRIAGRKAAVVGNERIVKI